MLAPPDADRAHPAFQNLFVETEWHEWCTADHRHAAPALGDRAVALWCVHVVATGTERVGAVTCETDRARFIGRGRSTRDPLALEADGPLSGTTGAVLDPIFALRVRVRLEPGQSASVAFTTLVAPTRERAFELADRYHDPHAAQRALDLAWTAAQIELRELNIYAGRRRGLPGARRAPVLSPTRRSARRRTSAAEPRRAAAALGAGHLRRLADPARHDRLAGGAADAASAASRRTSTGGGAA